MNGDIVLIHILWK